MPTIKQLEEQGHALFVKQQALALDESRPWSEKAAEFDRIDVDIKSVIEQRDALVRVGDGNPFAKVGAAEQAAAAAPVAAKSAGEQFTDSAGYKNIQGMKGGKFSAVVDVKVAGTITEAGTGAGGVIPQYLPGVVPTLFRRLTISDLMPQATMNSTTITYVQEGTLNNGAATVAEGAAKPLSDISLTQVQETARKIATVAKISDEMLQDVPYITSYVNGRLTLFVQLAEEDQLLNGTGVAPNLRGLLQRSGLTAAQAVAADTRLDAIFKEVTKIRVNSFLEPDAIVIHPTDWQSIRLLKDGQGQYYGGGPFSWGPYGGPGSGGFSTILGDGGERLWGLRVVVTTAITAGTALLGAFSTAAEVFRRTGLTVEMTNSNEDDFKNNLVAIRAEERLALALYRPSALGTVTGL